MAKRKKGTNGSDEVIESKTENDSQINQENKEVKPKKLTPKKQALLDYYNEVLDFTYQITKSEPQDVKQCTCSVCGDKKSKNEYFRNYSIINSGTINTTGERHLTVCKKCTKRIFNYLSENSDQKDALIHWCQMFDMYYDEDIYKKTLDLRDSRKKNGDMAKKFDFLTDYITALGTARKIGLTFWDSPLLSGNIESMIDTEEDVILDTKQRPDYPEEFEDWEEDDLEVYDRVLEIYRYDPFKDEPLDDRRKLYYNLSGFSDESFIDDTGKMNACVDMCRSTQRLEKLNRLRINEENSEDPDIKKLKMISELQEKERKSIQQYQKEWAFNQRYALNKQQGLGTLTGIMKQMDIEQFEDALVNRYDIETCEGMRQAAEASWSAIFSQLNISESEYAKIVSDQNETIRKLDRDLKDIQEQLRLANVELKRKELEDILISTGGDKS